MDADYQQHFNAHKSLLSLLSIQQIKLPTSPEEIKNSWAKMKDMPLVPIALYQEIVTDLNGWYSYHSTNNSAHLPLKDLAGHLASYIDRNEIVLQFFPHATNPAQRYFAAEHLALNIIAMASQQADCYRTEEGLFEKQPFNVFDSIADLVKTTFPEISPSRKH